MNSTNEIVYVSTPAEQEMQMDKLIVCAALKLNADKWSLQFVCDWCDKQLNTFASILKHYLLEHMCISDEKAQEIYTKHVGDFNANNIHATDACEAAENSIILKEEEIEFDENSIDILDDNVLRDELEVLEVELLQRMSVEECADESKSCQGDGKISRKFNCNQCGKECYRTRYQTTCCSKCYNATNSFRCNVCDILFKRRFNLKKHMKTKHKLETDATAAQNKKFHCLQCGKECQRSRFQNIYCNKCYGASRPFKCNICNRSYTRNAILNDHRRKRHTVMIGEIANSQDEQEKAAKSKPITGKKKRYNCAQCGELYVETLTETKLCRKCNSANKPHACHLCDAKFADKSNLMSHLRRHSGIKPFLCPICGKAFVSGNDLKRHIKQTHNKERPFGCDECGKRYPTKGRLNLHLRRHRNERNYECTECGKCFFDTNRLTAHMQIHSKDKPFACHICELKFPIKSYLSEHLKVHSNFKAYKCEVCSEAFVQIAGLCSHRKRHHPDFNRENANTN